MFMDDTTLTGEDLLDTVFAQEVPADDVDEEDTEEDEEEVTEKPEEDEEVI